MILLASGVLIFLIDKKAPEYPDNYRESGLFYFPLPCSTMRIVCTKILKSSNKLMFSM